jgi:hypothetical protein
MNLFTHLTIAFSCRGFLFSQKLVAYERDPHTVDRLSHTAAEGESVAEGSITNTGSGGGVGSGGGGGGSGSRSGNGGGGGSGGGGGGSGSCSGNGGGGSGGGGGGSGSRSGNGGSGSRSGNGGGGGVAALPTHVRAAEESFDASASTARQELAAAETALGALLKLQPTTRAGLGAGEATGEVFLTTS